MLIPLNDAICEPVCKKNLHMASFQCKDVSFGILYYVSLLFSAYNFINRILWNNEKWYLHIMSMSRSHLRDNLHGRLNPLNEIFKVD